MQRARLFLVVFFTTLCLLGQLETACAAITYSGDIDPADPTTWDNSTTGFVGKTGKGSVTVDSGDTLESLCCYFGYEATADGTVTVTGVGSTWTNSSILYIGNYGSGTLAITDGGGRQQRPRQHWAFYRFDE